MEKHKNDTRKIYADELPTPDAVADVIANEILATTKINGRIISQQILKAAILTGFAKIELAGVDDEQGAPLDPIEIQNELTNAISKSVHETFQLLGAKKQLAAVVSANATYAAKSVFDKYFIR